MKLFEHKPAPQPLPEAAPGGGFYQEVVFEEVPSATDAPQSPAEPAPEQPTPSAPRAARPEKRPTRRRRTGTLTLGLALILVGGCILAYTFLPAFDLFTVAKLSPVLLILLGGEILCGAFRSGDEYRVNFWSVLMCLFLTGCCMCLALVPLVWEYVGPDASRRNQAMQAQFEQECFDLLGGDTLSRMGVTISAEGSGAEHLDALEPGSYVGVSATLAGQFEDEDAFAAACFPVLDALTQVVDPTVLDSVHLASEPQGEDGHTYSLSPSGLFMLKADPAILAAGVHNDAEELARIAAERAAEEAMRSENIERTIQESALATAEQQLVRLYEGGYLTDEELELAVSELYELRAADPGL